MFQEFVDFARRNSPGGKYAGTLENLAEVFEITAKRHPEDARSARDEARALLRKAEMVYMEIDDEEGVSKVQSKLTNLTD